MEEDYYVSRIRSSQDALTGVTNFSFPTPILAFAPVEGTDYPIFTRDELASAPIHRNWAGALQGKVLSSQISTWGLGMPATVFGAPPDETPIIVGKSLYDNAANFNAARKAKFSVAARADEDAPGAWAEIIPATEYTVTVCQLLSEIQEHLLEEVNGGVSFGSGLWTTAEVIAYLNLRLSRFLVETGVVQVRTLQAAAAADDFWNLPTDLIDLRRAAWVEGSTTTPLPRIDSMQADLWQAWETNTGTPLTHMLVPEPSLQIRLAPQPANNGTLDLIYVANFDPVIADCSVLPIPDEWTPYIKWGVISDMLSKEGEANDPQRAGYAEKRWDEGIALARVFMGTNQ